MSLIQLALTPTAVVKNIERGPHCKTTLSASKFQCPSKNDISQPVLSHLGKRQASISIKNSNLLNNCFFLYFL